MKKRFLFVFALLSALTITGCNEDNKKQGTLSAPQEIMVQSDGNRSLIIFDEVENADYYNIYINDMSITVKGNGSGTIQFDASKIITMPQTYTIKVKAGSDRYFDSKFSEDYQYNHTSVLDAPIISIDGTTLNWAKIEHAGFYDVLVTTSNPANETIHRFSTNKFNFSNLLVNKGEYLFKVRAVSENGEFLPSIYSNQVKYTNVINLITPYNFSTNYDLDTGEMLLSFVSSEGVNDFTLNIDGTNYNISHEELNRFLYPDDLDNVYIIKLNSFARSRGIDIKNSRLMNISVKANASDIYVRSSQFSSGVTCQFVNVLNTPQIMVKNINSKCVINISSADSTYLSGHAIYLNDKKYKTLSKDVTQVELPLSEVGSAGIRVQAISNNNNCYSSKLSDAKYASNNANILNALNITTNNNIISWAAMQNVTKYYIEISNAVYNYGQFIQATSIDISTLCVPNRYSVRVIAMAEGYNQSERTITLDYKTKLKDVENLSITTLAESTYLYFDEVADSYGYTIYLNNVMVNRLFTSSPININAYVSTASGYDIKVKAV
ncbi:MAG: hypothetical protein J6Q15_02975, partial [Clostridia bacterium]|nr:hypothetical protein [Clostridia bacterium]